VGKRFLWTKDKVFEEAKKYSSKKEWKQKSPTSYIFAHRNGIIDECAKHMCFLWSKKWDRKSIVIDSKKYTSLSEWELHSKAAVRKARQLGILEEVSAHMKKNKKWSNKEIIEDARKYKTKTEWAKNSKAYYYAKKRNIFNACCGHMVKPTIQKKWTTTTALDEASKYSTRGEWLKKSSASYRYCRDNGLLDLARGHMPHNSGVSIPEKDLLKIIRDKYPKAHSTYFTVKDPKFAPAKRFQLDIYIPELRKGIEFNGDYWHSFEGLARSRKPKGWSDDQILRYHDLKKNFFEHIGIPLFIVWEKQWKENPNNVINTVLNFLEVVHGTNT